MQFLYLLVHFQINPDIKWKATPRPKIVMKEGDPTWPKNQSNALSNQEGKKVNNRLQPKDDVYS